MRQEVGWRCWVACIGDRVTRERMEDSPVWAIPLHFLLASWKKWLCQHPSLLGEP